MAYFRTTLMVNLITQGSQHQAIITDFSLQEGDVDRSSMVMLVTTSLERDLTAPPAFFAAGGVPELIGTLEGVTGLDLNSDAFQYFDDEAEGPGMELPRDRWCKRSDATTV